MDLFQDVPIEFYTRKEYPARISINCKIGMKPPKGMKVRKPIELRSVQTARVSARRSKAIINDICECNDFQYFVNLTFGIQDRLNDSSVKNEWDNWRREFRKKFPNASYIAVPEYHKKGGLHIHMCIAGVTSDSLKLQKTNYVCCSWTKRKYQRIDLFEKQKSKHVLTSTDGIPIFNVGAWDLGLSQCTEIKHKNGVYKYISKYISKGSIDPRFCDAKRYWCSRNVKRPVSIKYQSYNTLKLSKIDEHVKLYPLEFYLPKTGYYVFLVADLSGYNVPSGNGENDITIRKTLLLRIDTA